MALNPISEDLDPLLWAKRPRSQCALSLLRTGAAEGSGELATILSSHVRDGVCDESGKLLMRWDGLRRVSLAAERVRYAACPIARRYDGSPQKMGVCARQIHERLPQVREDPFWDGQTSHNAADKPTGASCRDRSA